MNNNLTQSEEVDMVLKEFGDFFAKSEIENSQTRKSKSSRKKSPREESDDDYYIPLYKTSFFN